MWRILLYLGVLIPLAISVSFTCSQSFNILTITFGGDPGRICGNNFNNSITSAYYIMENTFNENYGDWGGIDVTLYGIQISAPNIFVAGDCFSNIANSEIFCSAYMPYVSSSTNIDNRFAAEETNYIYIIIADSISSMFTVKWNQTQGPVHEIPDGMPTNITIPPNGMAAGFYFYQAEVYYNAYSLAPGTYWAYASISFTYGGAIPTSVIDGNLLTITLDNPVYIYIYIYIYI